MKRQTNIPKSEYGIKTDVHILVLMHKKNCFDKVYRVEMICKIYGVFYLEQMRTKCHFWEKFYSIQVTMDTVVIIVDS